MKDILYLLSSDAENLSLVLSYQKLVEKGYQVDCYAPRIDKLSLYPFIRANPDFNCITTLTPERLNQYRTVVCGRNCFDIPHSESLLSYPGTIIADDTCFYEGHSVYGDVVCVCGAFNYRNVPDFLKETTCTTGCLKADYSNVTPSVLWEQASGYKQKVLFIESGHFPFGTEGRRRLARAFCDMVKAHPDSFFIVKPRFLEDEVMCAKHHNADHLYRYIHEEFRGRIPANLLLLDSHAQMNELVLGADVCICTYCSAHIEVVFAEKKLINICDVPSEETADFRKNRSSLIADVMDLAGCNTSVHTLSEALDHPRYAAEDYVKKVNQCTGDAVDSFTAVVENVLNGNQKMPPHSVIAENRFLGYSLKKVSYLENRLDDYSIGNSLLDALRRINARELDLSGKRRALERLLRDFMFEYIACNQEFIQKNDIQRAFVLKYLADDLPDERTAQLAEVILRASRPDDAPCSYYHGILAWKQKQYRTAVEHIRRFLVLSADKPYAKTALEDISVINNMRKLYSEVEELI